MGRAADWPEILLQPHELLTLYPRLAKVAEDVLRAIGHVVEAAHEAGIWVGLCGEMASDPFAIPLLIGLGVDILSVPAKIYLRAKSAVRSMNFEKFSSLSQRALSMPTADEIRRLVEEEVK